MYQGLMQGASQIAQGAALYILNRKDLSVVPATVVNVSQPHMSKSTQTNPALALQGFVVDLTLNMGNETITIEFPVNSANANYPEKGWFVTNDRMAAVREIETAVNLSKQALAQGPYHEKMIQQGERSIMQLNPEKQKEAQQAQEIATLQQRLADMERRTTESGAKLDKVLEMLSANLGASESKQKTK